MLFAGVFDGHFTAQVSETLSNLLPVAMSQLLLHPTESDDSVREQIVRACLGLDDTIVFPTATPTKLTPLIGNKRIALPQPVGGSTAAFALVAHGRLVLCNVGDSRCLIIKRSVDSVDRWHAEQPLIDHRAESKDEKHRILAAGARVEDGQVEGVLNLSRAFGDRSFKRYNIFKRLQPESDTDRFMLVNPTQQPITAMPDIFITRWPPDIEQSGPTGVVICTDGITDVLSNDQIAEIIGPALNGDSKQLAAACNNLCITAIRAGSNDNVTAVAFNQINPNQANQSNQTSLLPSRTLSDEKTDDGTIVAWNDYTVGPYYDWSLTFHDAFVNTARLHGASESQIQQLIAFGKLQTPTKSQSVKKRELFSDASESPAPKRAKTDVTTPPTPTIPPTPPAPTPIAAATEKS
jgi:serine/threonine protein phosphatase PrpC